eukprot:TRINITY_DN7777_c0_g1_i1.p1 TRINITY_DN7777_c0_g1~~TRINITY_DN7777_c0_g1_i1.p1  ORF type:complete len:117 (-),score=22.66 TRINITY_DN7777_c0_g1_i1:31-381(-)
MYPSAPYYPYPLYGSLPMDSYYAQYYGVQQPTPEVSQASEVTNNKEESTSSSSTSPSTQNVAQKNRRFQEFVEDGSTSDNQPKNKTHSSNEHKSDSALMPPPPAIQGSPQLNGRMS